MKSVGFGNVEEELENAKLFDRFHYKETEYRKQLKKFVGYQDTNSRVR